MMPARLFRALWRCLFGRRTKPATTITNVRGMRAGWEDSQGQELNSTNRVDVARRIT